MGQGEGDVCSSVAEWERPPGPGAGGSLGMEGGPRPAAARLPGLPLGRRMPEDSTANNFFINIFYFLFLD